MKLPETAQLVELNHTTFALCRWCKALTLPRDAMSHWKWHRAVSRELAAMKRERKQASAT